MRRQPGSLIASLALFVIAPAHAAEKLSEHTWKLSAGEKSPPATLADMAWLTGHWMGEAFGGTIEELWTAPAGKDMSGMYRLLKGGKTIFYELMLVTEVNGSLEFRLKHFNADLSGWEEKADVISFPLVAKRDGAMLFQGMSFHPDGDKLTIHLAVEHKDKPVEEVTFSYRRAGKH